MNKSLPIWFVWIALVSCAIGKADTTRSDVCIFYPNGYSREKAGPSLALVREPNSAQSPGFAPRPAFSTSSDGKPVASLGIEDGTDLYGEGEVRAPLLRNKTRAVCWNTDNYLALGNDRPLYQSHPWVLGVRKDGSAFGVFADTTWRTEIDLSS